jgi:hypothetical protein
MAPRKEKAVVTIDFGDLGRWPVEIDPAILRRLKRQAEAEGYFALEDKAEARRFGGYLGNSLSSMIRREFAAPTPAQVGYARRIADQLGLDVPVDVWESKELISEFIGKHNAEFERGKESSGTGPRRIE